MIMNNCGEAFHTDSWLAETNPGHSDPDAILQALLPGPRTVVLYVLFGPGEATMGKHQQIGKAFFGGGRGNFLENNPLPIWKFMFP